MGGPLGPPGRDRGVRRRGDAARERPRCSFPKDRKGIEPNPDFLLSIHEQSGAYLTSAVLAAIAALVLIGVFLYLFRASMARGAAVPHWFIYLVVGASDPVRDLHGARRSSTRSTSVTSSPPEPRSAARPASDRARDLSDSSAAARGRSPPPGTVGLAFLFVMLPLRARRVGLLTPVHGHPRRGRGRADRVPFQLPGARHGASGLLARRARRAAARAAGRAAAAPRGRAAEAEPWPTAAQRRGLRPMPGEEQEPTLDPTPPEPEPVPERPKSRKRRRKR